VGHASQFRACESFCMRLVGGAAEQNGVLDSVASKKSAQPSGVRQLVGFLKRKRDDLQTLRPIFAINFGQKRRFVVAVGAPAPGDIHQDHFAFEARIGVADQLAVEIGKAEAERLGCILDAGVARGSSGSGRPLARATAGLIAVILFLPLSTRFRVPSAARVISSSAGRMPEKWLRVNLPS